VSLKITPDKPVPNVNMFREILGSNTPNTLISFSWAFDNQFFNLNLLAFLGN
jgi:hypothetical protein